MAALSLVTEARLTPKPGLVDQRNTGAHTDMDLSTFMTSAAALEPLFILRPVAPHPDDEPFGQSVHNARADAVQTARDLVA